MARPLTYRPWVRGVGWVLYLGSMLTPAAGPRIVGVQALVLAPKAILILLESRPSSPLPALGLALGLAANLIPFVRVAPAVCVSAVLAPWLAWIQLSWHAQGFSLTAPFVLTFYFPWAVGIVLLNSTRGGVPQRAIQAAPPRA